METTQTILKELNRWLLGQLGERRAVSLPYLGEIGTNLLPAHIKESGGLRTMFPPSVSLVFRPDEFLLDSRHYSSLDLTLPPTLSGEDVVYALSDLLGLPKSVVAETLDAELQELLKALFRGKRVSLLDIGDLFVTDEGEDLLLLNFEPSSSVLDHLNRPFAPYAPTPLKMGVDFKELTHYGENDEGHSLTSLQRFRIVEVEAPQIVVASSVEIEEPTLPDEDMKTLPEEPIMNEEEEMLPRKQRPKSLVWLLLIGLSLLLAGGYWLLFLQKTDSPPLSPTQAAVKDTVPEAVLPADTVPISKEKPAIDTLTITSGRSLYSYAKEYYGQKMFWIYIYIENAAIIKDPNRISLGTKLVIPDLSKFEINPDMRIAVKEAMVWESVIMSKKFTTYEETHPIVLERLAKQ